MSTTEVGPVLRRGEAAPEAPPARARPRAWALGDRAVLVVTLSGSPEHDRSGYYLVDHGRRIPVSRAGYERAVVGQDRLLEAAVTLVLVLSGGVVVYQRQRRRDDADVRAAERARRSGDGRVKVGRRHRRPGLGHCSRLASGVGRRASG